MRADLQASPSLSWIGRWHGTIVFERRARVLAELLASRLPRNASVLDIGCGNGTVGSLIAELRRDITIQGVELLVRPGCKIPCREFDGSVLPFAPCSFDVCIFVDVLHHTDNISALLREAARVSRCYVLLKDHLRENALDDLTLRFMDWVGNRPHGVRLTNNYRSYKQWSNHFSESRLSEENWTTEVPLYPAPLSLFAGRKLHFIALLRKAT